MQIASDKSNVSRLHLIQEMTSALFTHVSFSCVVQLNQWHWYSFIIIYSYANIVSKATDKTVIWERNLIAIL